MPHKRKIVTPEPPKRSSRIVGIGKQKIRPGNTVLRKAHARGR